MPKKFIFTLTTGRSGSFFLNDLFELNLANSVVYAERTGALELGEVSPECSHMKLFNEFGTTKKIRSFWEKKFEADLSASNQDGTDIHIETDHRLFKAGLIENLDLLARHCDDIHIIILRRDIYKIVWSLYNRYEFTNFGHTWLYWIDPRSSNTIIKSKAFRKLGHAGLALWYVYEVFARAEYYKLLFANIPWLTFHDVALEEIVTPNGAKQLFDGLDFSGSIDLKLPGKTNVNPSFPFAGQEQKVKSIVSQFNFDPVELAQKFIDNSMRLSRQKYN